MKFHSIRTYSLLIFLSLHSSCASIFNNTTHRITISIDTPLKSILVNGKQVPIINDVATAKLERNKEPLTIHWQGKDSIRTTVIKSKNSFNYLISNFFTCGLGYLLEKNRPKRYYHQKNIYIEEKNNRIRTARFSPIPKSSNFIGFSIPYINHYYLRTIYGYRHEFGFLGTSVTAEHYFRKNLSIALTGGIAINNEAPFPIAAEYFGKYKRDYTRMWFISLIQRNTVGSFTFGYGINFSRCNWIENDNTGNTFIQNKLYTKVLGFNFGSSYRITRHFHAGVIYQPGLFILDGKFSSTYQHLLSLELAFKFGLKEKT